MTDTETVDAEATDVPALEPAQIMWNGIAGVECPVCRQTFLDDGSINVDRAYRDHMANVHTYFTANLMANQDLDRPASDMPVPAITSVPPAEKELEPILKPPVVEENETPPPPHVALGDEWPKWYQDLRDKADKDAVEIPDLLSGETQKQYDERTGGS